MEIKEAIEAIKSNKPTSGYTVLCESLDIAVSALEKQIPKKLRVEVDNRHGVRSLYYFCPSCNSFRMESRKYCSNCGQSLDWEETFREWGQTKAAENLKTILEESNSK